ncbi:MAG: MotA/TolQ/ExbB proton channel family protein [Alphaproteobacteria bacterium]|nr:MotA/TolQ/ExbB proton channel family protein [Alphaproteobacteria bacterium]MBL7100258.1 MotA/TolQ/ExbB proton channel family protein [Alphaproteobacteria bacterium]
MISKNLTIAAAFVLFTGLGFGPALAQTTPPPAPTMAAPSSTAAPAPAPAPAPAVTAPAPAAPTASSDNPYGLEDIVKKGNPVSLTVLALLAVMSAGTWYIFFMKFFEQSRILTQARTVEKRFWTSGTLAEGVDKLPKNSMFRSVADAGIRASQGGTSLVGLNDWIAMSLSRQLEDANGRLQSSIAFLASVGSTAPFVGLFGTVWGILQALIAIGVAGQASIDKVAGPVGEALIMTAIGLMVAVPAVLIYNYLVRRNKVINEKLRGFAGDLQTYLITKSAK